MFRYSSIESIPRIFLVSYYAIVLISFLYFLIKYRGSLFNIFIIFLFYPGLFTYFELLNNPYKVVILFLGLMLVIKKKAITTLLLIKYRWIALSFILFSCSFLYSGYFNHDGFSMVFSQYSKYLLVFFFFFLIRHEFKNSPNLIPTYIKLIFSLILTQIILAFCKLIFIGSMESIVASLAFQGGALGTVFPIIGFIFLWTIRNGKFNTNDWLMILGLFVIGLASDKRAIWFMLPFTIFIFSTFMSRKKVSFQILPLIALLPVLFYFGVRLTPTLNPENEVWGSFDMDHVIFYTERYMFGLDDAEGQGRGGATILLATKLVNAGFSSNDLFGYGMEKYNGSDYEEFESYGFGIQSKGAATGFFQSYIGGGFIGIFTTLFFFLSIFSSLKIKRYTNIILGIVIWEYFLYAGLIFRIQILMFMLIFCFNLRNYNLQNLLIQKNK